MSTEERKVDRRGFIAASIGGLVTAGAAALTPGRLFAQEKPVAPETKSGGEVIHRTLGKTGIKVPIVSMGVMNSNNPEVVQASYEHGVRHFDTAAAYQYGRNEQMVGAVIKKLGVRDKVIIATKEPRPRRQAGMTDQQLKQEAFDLCDGSLKRLKMDYVDILYYHNVTRPEDFNDPVLMEAMADLKKQGKIRAAGVSTHSGMASVLNEVAKGGVYDVVLTAINVTMADDSDLHQAIAGAAKKGIGVIAMKTQAGGGRLPNPDSLKEYAGSTIATASLKWVLRNDNITTAIPGYDNFQHMKEDFSVAYGIDYTEDEEKFLGDNRITLGMAYCRQCKTCVASCPQKVDIPSLMRTHMYAAQYANFHEARATLKSIAKERSLAACGSCESCTAKCANQVDIARRIENLRAMYA